MNSDKEIIAKVEMTDPANYWSRGCLMIRENLTSNSPMAFIGLTKLDASNNNAAQFIWRSFTGAGTGVTTLDKYKIFPSYIKLVRIGNTFSGYWSRDGEIWEFVDSQTININQNCYIGLGASANNKDRFTGAVFSDVKINNIPEPAILGLVGLIAFAFRYKSRFQARASGVRL